MSQWKVILDRLLHPPFALTILLGILSALFLLITFLSNQQETLLGYVSYTLSAYGLTVLAFSTPIMVKKGKKLLYINKFSHRYLTDLPFRTQISLYLSLILNLLYAVFKLFAGIIYTSFWFVAVAVYYIILSIARFLLLRHLNTSNKNHNLAHEYLQYRHCGCLLLILSLTLIGIIIEMIQSGKGYHYSGYLIYAVSAYAFYNIAFTIISIVNYRKFNSPILSATKAINLVSALVAMFSLQTAMFTSFGGTPHFQRTMNMVVGGVISTTILSIALLMIINANQKIKKLNNNNIQIH